MHKEEEGSGKHTCATAWQCNKLLMLSEEAAGLALMQEHTAVCEGLFLAATVGGMLVARALPDGRFIVLHNLARPPDARVGCLPYPTWQLRSQASSASPG